MPKFRDLFPKIFSGRSREKAARREELANKARDTAFTAFQKLLKDQGYVDKRTEPVPDDRGEPTRDTQGSPSTNPVAVRGREGPPFLRTDTVD